MRETLRRLDALQQRRPWLSFPLAVVKKYSDDRAGNLKEKGQHWRSEVGQEQAPDNLANPERQGEAELDDERRHEAPVEELTQRLGLHDTLVVVGDPASGGHEGRLHQRRMRGRRSAVRVRVRVRVGEQAGV